MDIAEGREREMLELFHNQFVPEAVKHEGYIRVKMLKRHVYTTGPGGIWVLSPEGKHLGTIAPPEVPANCGWATTARRCT